MSPLSIEPAYQVRRRWRFALPAECLLLLSIALIAALPHSIGHLQLWGLSAQPPSLAEWLEQDITRDGIDAAMAQAGRLRSRGFAGFRESEAATNALGYRLLGQGDAKAAVQVFQFNADTHPDSANVFDSLAEAEIALGRPQDAILAYTRALALDPQLKPSALGLAKLTGTPRPPLPMLIRLHIAAGLCGMVLGFVALLSRKGQRLHQLSGDGFFVCMLAMSGAGAYLSIGGTSQPANLLAAVFTIYLLVTSWSAARRRTHSLGWSYALFLLLGWSCAVMGLSLAIQALRDQSFLAPFIVFGVVSTLASVMDLRVVLHGGITGPARIARHLWRMCTALLIATSSFFLGQAQLFPRVVRDTALIALPTLAVLLAMLYWLVKILYWDRRATAPLACSALTGPR